MAKSVLIVEDHPSFRTSASRAPEDAACEIVGEAVDGASALAPARTLRPDVVLLDVQFPDSNGFETAARLTSQVNAPMVVLTSSREALSSPAWSRALRLVGSCRRPNYPGGHSRSC